MTVRDDQSDWSLGYVTPGSTTPQKHACKCLGCMVVGMLLQGREADVVIFSCVRANAEGSLGHTSDTCRMNVGLTRAKYAHKSAHQ